MTSCFYGRFRITSPRGYRNIGTGREYHGGLDLVAIDDTQVRAIADGKVQTLSEPNGFGTYIRQTIYDNMRVYYGHMSRLCVPNGTYVHKGDVIGIMGSTGRSTGAHTHLELRVPGTSKESLDIAEFCGIDNAIGLYCYYPADICADKLCACAGLDANTRAYLLDYPYAEDLVNKLYTGMCRASGKVGTGAAYDAACKAQDRCGLSKATMDYLWDYKYADALMVKLWGAMV